MPLAEVAPDGLLQKLGGRRNADAVAHSRREDRRLRRLEPACGISDGQHDLGFRIRGSQLAPKMAARIVDGRTEAVEDLRPIRPAVGGVEPVADRRRIRPHLDHVIAGLEAEYLERDLQGQSSRPPEADADDVESHVRGSSIPSA